MATKKSKKKTVARVGEKSAGRAARTSSAPPIRTRTASKVKARAVTAVAKTSDKGSAKPAKGAVKKSVGPSRSKSSPNGGPKADAGWHLRLYVAGDSPRSRLALANLRTLCEQRLTGHYEIEVIDLTKLPHLAKADQILAVPTLVRSIPEPMKRIIGDLSNADRALIALDLENSIVKAP